MKIRNLKFHFLEGDPEGELWTSLFCWDLSLLMLWHNNLYMSNSDIIFVVHMWLDSTVPCDQHVWQFQTKTSLQYLFKLDIKNVMMKQHQLSAYYLFVKRHNPQTSTVYALSFYYLLRVYRCILTTIKVYWTSKTCWWIIRVNKNGFFVVSV